MFAKRYSLLQNPTMYKQSYWQLFCLAGQTLNNFIFNKKCTQFFQILFFCCWAAIYYNIIICLLYILRQEIVCNFLCRTKLFSVFTQQDCNLCIVSTLFLRARGDATLYDRWNNIESTLFANRCALFSS